jgi:hypothetical protein
METREMREKGETWEGGEMGDEYPPARVYFGITFMIRRTCLEKEQGKDMTWTMVCTTCRHKERDIA